jgi:hypothetical protein
VADGLVTPERAREVYGVVLGPETGTAGGRPAGGRPAGEMELDEVATAKLREERKS